MLDITKLDFMNHFVYSLTDLVLRDAFERSVKFQMLTGSQVFKKNVMLRAHSQVLSKPCHIIKNIVSHKRSASVCRFKKPC